VTAKPKWRKFEELVHKIQSDLASDAQVRLDDRIEGALTGTMRQVDISIRRKIGQFEMLIAIDCKDLAQPVDVKDVEGVIGLIQDVGANKGAVVSASGFTPAALARGKGAGLDLYRLVDTGSHDWKAHASIPVLIHYTALRRYAFTFRATGPVAIPMLDPREIEILSMDERDLGKLGDLFLARWSDERIPRTAGSHVDVDFLGGPVRIRHAGQTYEVSITATVDVDHALYFHHLPLQEISGLKDEVSGAVATKGFTTTSIDVTEIETKWQKLDSEKDLAVNPVMTLWMSN
jgi:hypothetical protein